VRRGAGERGDETNGRAGMLITTVNGVAVAEHPMAKFCWMRGLQAGAMGFNVRI
jgi:ATP-dependent Lhr-like helicase